MFLKNLIGRYVKKKTFYIIYRRVIDQLAIISNYLHVKCFLIIPVRDTIYFSN